VAYAELAAAIGIVIPSAAVVWFLLGRYEGHFEDNRLFFAMGAGIFSAIVIRFLEVNAFAFDNLRLIQPSGEITSGTLVYSFAYTTFGFALLEALGMTAILGFKKFRMRKDSAYYGAALGLSFGAMWSLSFVSSWIVRDGSGHLITESWAILYDAFLLFLGFGLALAHGAAGTWIGREAGAGKLMRCVTMGTVWLAIALACSWLFVQSHDQVTPALSCLAWGVFALYWADKRILQVIVPPEIRDMIRKERRRERRRQA
jgi:hypothetical protein